MAMKTWTPNECTYDPEHDHVEIDFGEFRKVRVMRLHDSALGGGYVDVNAYLSADGRVSIAVNYTPNGPQDPFR